jgi:hypothetical protein
VHDLGDPDLYYSVFLERATKALPLVLLDEKKRKRNYTIKITNPKQACGKLGCQRKTERLRMLGAPFWLTQYKLNCKL